MTTAIVILNWNGEKYLKQFLPILIANTPLDLVEIIVADNASTDGSLELLSKCFPSVRKVVLDKNYGFAGGYNKALEQVTADYYVLLNSDVEVTPNWLEPLVAFMNQHADVAACQPKILSFHQRTHFEHAGAAGGFIDKYGFPFCRGRVFGTVEEDRGQYDDVVDVFWASGACLLVRADLFWRVGGLDEFFFAHMEEIDLCWRFKCAGYRVVSHSGSKVYHIGGGTLSVESPRKTYLNFRNNLLLLYKNLPDHLLKKILFWRFFFDYAAALQFLLVGNLQNALSVFKARRDFREMQPSFDAKRRENHLNSKTLHPAGILQKSIVFEYYLRNRRIFSAFFWK